MNKQLGNHSFFLVTLIVLSSFFNACVDPQKLVYFPNQKDTILPAIEAPEPIIQENDILSITVSSLSQEASALFNTPNIPVVGGSSSGLGTSAGYLVSTTGYIDFPVLGKVKASGLTKPLLADFLKQSLISKGLLLDPIISIRQLNYHITVLGEFGRPGIINIPSEKINIIELLGQAGDLTLFANRKNVVLIREENGKRLFRRLDFNNPEILSSPYYFLKSNDVLYAEPNKVKALGATNQGLLIGYAISGVGILFSLMAFLLR